MSWWPGASGRYSPFTSFYSRSGPPPVTEDDYSYLSGEGARTDKSLRDNSYPIPSTNTTTTTHHHIVPHHTSSSSPRALETAELGPDILILKHKNATYPLHFPAFSIADGDLKVHDVRAQAARELRVDDPRRVKLFYKGKKLREDKESCKYENLKQNSEVMCVVNAEPILSHGREDAYGSSDSAESSSITNGVENGPRVDVDGTLVDGGRRRKRKGRRGGGKKKRDVDTQGNSGKGNPLASSTTGSGVSRSRSPSPSPNHVATSVAPPPPPPPKKPLAPAAPLDQILEGFYSNHLPAVQAFLASPPAPGSKEREFEYKKLSENILQHVLLKLDGVETMGDEGLRGQRREIVKYVQGVLVDLDRVGKR
ncbi:MAG: hypothetical protein Q9217_005184 [Psora testacea]